MVHPKSSGVSHNKNASTYCPKRSTGKTTSSTLSSSVQKSITELKGKKSGKGKAKKNEREHQQARMETVEHDVNDNDGLEDVSTQDAILSDSEGTISVSEESTVDTIENQASWKWEVLIFNCATDTSPIGGALWLCCLFSIKWRMYM